MVFFHQLGQLCWSTTHPLVFHSLWSLLGGVALSMLQGGRSRKNPGRRRIELQSILQSLPEAAFLFDRQGHIVQLNYAAEQLVRMQQNDVVGQTGSVLDDPTAASDDSSSAQAIVAHALQGDHVRHQHHIFRRGDSGESRELLVSGNPVCGPAGDIVGALLVAQDVTQLSSLQRQVADSERHLAVGQMTAGLAHDFNNVLSSISEAVYVLETRKQGNDEDRRMLGIIDCAVRRGSEIVSNIREYLRGDRQTRLRIDLPQLLTEVLQMTMVLLETRSSVQVVRELEAVPPVMGVSAELRRVFTNLVRNALEAMPHGGRLTLRCYSAQGRVIASIADTGAGIASEQQGQVFSPYFTTKAQGTGLGLAGARRAIEAHGGEIRFESTAGVGTTFFVSLPIASGAVIQRPSQVA